VCAKKTANERAQERKKNNNKKREIRVSIFINLIFFQLLNQTLPIIYLFIFKTGEKYMFSSLIQFVLFVMFIFFHPFSLSLFVLSYYVPNFYYSVTVEMNHYK
jgi:hypothetical protein